MEWINPQAFWLLPLIAVLFLFARRRVLDERWVGNLYLWTTSAPPDPSQLAVRRLRRHWLIALQTGVMLAVIAALAHPAISSAARRAIFIVDLSASMGARNDGSTRLAEARTRAIAAAAALPSRSRVRLIAVGSAPVDLGEFSVGAPDLTAALEHLTPTDGSAALLDAINAARVRDDETGDIYVFTDQRAPATMPVAAAHWTQVGHTAENLAITALASARAPSDPAAVQVLVTVHNFGSAAHTTSLELLRDAAIVGRESIALAPRSSRAVTFAIRDAPASLRSPLPDEIHARLTMNDALAADNERWGLIPPNTPVRVRLITHGSTFLERALAANPGITLDVSHAPDLDAAARDTHDADVLVCGGCRSLPARGPAVLIIPDAPADPPRVLDSLSLTGATHAVTSDVDFTGLAARPLPRIAGTSGGETLARAGDVPAVIVSDHDGRRLVELNLDLSSSTLPLNVSFPLLLANAIDWLSARSEQNRSVTAGDPLMWAPADSPAQASAIGPGGRTIPVQVAGQTVIVTDTSMAGVYRVRAGNAERDFAVNPATETESDLSMPSTGHDDNAASAPRVSPLRRDDHIDRSGALPSALLIVALLLLAIEWRQFCRGAR